MKKITPLVAIGFLAVSLLANAQSQKPEPGVQMQAKAQERFRTLDTNADGKLSYAELQNNTARRQRFDQADLNHDGGLSQDELKQAHQSRQAQRQQRRAHTREKMQAAREKLERLDSNKDQALSRAEIGKEMPKLLENFDIIDGDNDGRITREEMRIARMAMRAERRSQAR